MGSPSDSTMRSAAPSLVEAGGDTLAIVGGTLLELHPARVEKADLLIRGDKIAQVGGEMPQWTAKLDATGCIVTPAFAVAHTHLYASLMCGMPPPRSRPQTLADILQWIWWTVDKALDLESVHVSALVGAVDCAKRGAVTVVDHHSSPRSIDGSLDQIEQALDEVGIRGVLCYETSDRDGRGRRDGGIRENERYLAKVRAGQSRHRAMVGAHALMTLNDDTLDVLRDLAAANDVGIHMHVAEDLTDDLDAERRKSTIAARLERLGIARKNSIVAHAVKLDPALVEQIAAAGGWLVTNPRSNMNHGVGFAKVTGPKVAFGTDGLDGDVIAEAKAHFFRHSEAKDGLCSEAGARVVAGQQLASALFGEHDGTPRVVKGTRADLAILDYDPSTPLSATNVVSHMVRGFSSEHVRDTIAGGKVIVQGRKVMNVDEKALRARARAASERLWERMQGYF